MKLTKAQAELARGLREHTGHVWDGYPPLKALLRAGYVEKAEGRYSDVYRLTEAGLNALALKENSDDRT